MPVVGIASGATQAHVVLPDEILASRDQMIHSEWINEGDESGRERRKEPDPVDLPVCGEVRPESREVDLVRMDVKD